MSFLEFMVTHMDYSSWGVPGFDLIRVLLWALVKLLGRICYAVEGLYNNIFKLFSIVYSPEVIGFIRQWIPFLWIPIAISIVILGYTLIMGEEGKGSEKLKGAIRNAVVFAIVLFTLPVLFLGTDNAQSGIIGAGNIAKAEGTDLFEQPSSGGSANTLVQGVQQLHSGSTNSQTYSLISEYVYDLRYIYEQVKQNKGSDGNLQSKTWSTTAFGAGNSSTHLYYKNPLLINPSQTKDSILSLAINDYIDYVNVKDIDKDDENALKLTDVFVEGYDHGDMQAKLDSDNDNDIRRPAFTLYNHYVYGNPLMPLPMSGGQTTSNGQNTTRWRDDGTSSTAPGWAGQPDTHNTWDSTNNSQNRQAEERLTPRNDNTPAAAWLFQVIHKEVYRQYDDTTGNGQVIGVFYGSDGKTQSGMIGGFGSTFPFVYHVEWGALFIVLIATTIVLFLTSYKIVRIIYELTVSQFLAVFFGAADLSNGQKIKEILKYIVSLLLSLFFAVVMVEFYFIVQSKVSTMALTGDSSVDGWVNALLTLFVAMAAIKGPSILEKILGVEGGLSGAWRDMGAVNRMTKPARRVASTIAKGAAVTAVAAGYLAHKHHSGKKNFIKEHSNSNKSKVGGIKDSSRIEKPGDSSQFSAINNGGKDRSPHAGTTATGVKDRDGKPMEAANTEMARQARDINAERAKIGDAETANNYKQNIQHAAMAEQSRAQLNGESLNDKEALTKAYEQHGFDSETAENLAKRDLADGSWTEKQDKFENSISTRAQELYNENPGAYANQMEAYNAAAQEHYRDLGFSADESKELSRPTAERVMLDDKQEALRERAAEIQRTERITDKKDDGTKYERKHTDEEALSRAGNEILGSQAVGYSGNAGVDAQSIMKNGTLKEGIRSGRMARNAERERVESNTRSNKLTPDMNPAAQAGIAVVGGYFAERTAESLHGAGYKAGYSSGERKLEKRAAKNYRKATKDRK